MIELRVGDIFKQSDLTHIVHQANLYCTFGSGIAYEIKKRFPHAFEADLAHEGKKLGRWSLAKRAGQPTIVNLYSQIGIGAKDRHTSYDEMDKALRAFLRSLDDGSAESSNLRIGVPYGIGCGLANGSWRIVSAILEDVFTASCATLVVCRRENDILLPRGLNPL